MAVESKAALHMMMKLHQCGMCCILSSGGFLGIREQWHSWWGVEATVAPFLNPIHLSHCTIIVLFPVQPFPALYYLQHFFKLFLLGPTGLFVFLVLFLDRGLTQPTSKCMISVITFPFFYGFIFLQLSICCCLTVLLMLI